MDHLPHNIEAEQQVIGALLLNNDLLDRVSSVVSAASFHDPVHRDLFSAISARIERGALASPVTVAGDLSAHEGLAQLGGGKYIAKLAGGSMSGHAIRHYADSVAEDAKRRALVGVADDLRSRAMSEPQGASDAIAEAEGRLYALAEGAEEERGAVAFSAAALAAVNSVNAARQRGGGLSGLPTGLVDLDKKTGGLNKSDLIILAGRPSMGKTALATNIALNMARGGAKVGFFSLEMSAEQLAGRILSDLSETPSDAARRGDLSDDEMRRYVVAASEFSGLPITIDDAAGLSIAQVANRARRMKRTRGLDVLFVDYLQLLKGSAKKDGGRVQEIGEISMGLKNIAKDLEIPVMALAQLSRSVETRDDKRPQLSDLRESGSIEQDADVVMFVYRDEYYQERLKPAQESGPKFAEWLEAFDRSRGKAEVVIGKQRHGPIGTVELAFQAQFTRFGNLSRAEY